MMIATFGLSFFAPMDLESFQIRKDVALQSNSEIVLPAYPKLRELPFALHLDQSQSPKSLTEFLTFITKSIPKEKIDLYIKYVYKDDAAVSRRDLYIEEILHYAYTAWNLRNHKDFNESYECVGPSSFSGYAITFIALHAMERDSSGLEYDERRLRGYFQARGLISKLLDTCSDAAAAKNLGIMESKGDSPLPPNCQYLRYFLSAAQGSGTFTDIRTAAAAR